MATLPTLTVDDTQHDRIIAAFGTEIGYTDWLRQLIIDFVVSRESQNRRAEFDAVDRTQYESDRTALAELITCPQADEPVVALPIDLPADPPTE